MPFRREGELRFYQFESMLSPLLVHALFTRHGGVSPAPWRSLNVGATVGDDTWRVLENRRRTLAAVGRDPASVFDVWQTHSADVVVAEAPRAGRELTQADAILTENPGVTLYMRFADCVPILLFDPNRGVIGLVHAGWLGTVRGVTTAAVRTMVKSYGCDASDVIAGLGPSIGPCHYPVGPQVVDQVRVAFGPCAQDYLKSFDGRVHFDLWRANRSQLWSQGVRQIELAEICTACEVRDWFSHRAERGSTGRFAALIALEG